MLPEKQPLPRTEPQPATEIVSSSANCVPFLNPLLPKNKRQTRIEPASVISRPAKNHAKRSPRRPDPRPSGAATRSNCLEGQSRLVLAGRRACERRLFLQRRRLVRSFPGKVFLRAAKVPVGCGLPVDRPAQVQALDNALRSQLEV